MKLDAYLAAAEQYLDDLQSKDFPFFPLLFAPRDPLSRQATSGATASSLKDLVRLQRRIAIVGPPGAGKTRAVRDLAKVFMGVEGHVPIYVSLRKLPRSTQHIGTWTDLVLQPLNTSLKEYGCELPSGKELARMVKGRDLVFLIDGFNEISDVDATNVLDALDTVPSRSHVVLTSRIREYPRDAKEYAVYDVRPLAFPSEVHGFLENILASLAVRDRPIRPGTLRDILDACKRDAVVKQMATNPYLLSQLCEVARQQRYLPRDRTSLLELVASNLLGEPALGETPIARFLADLAGEMHFERHCLSLSVGAIAACPHIAPSDPSAQAELLDRLIGARLILRTTARGEQHQRTLRESDEVGFNHQVFQEFFAGMHLYRERLYSKRAGAAMRIVGRYGKWHWNWEAISTAVVLLGRHDRQAAQALTTWLERRRPHLAALIQSETPDDPQNGGHNSVLNARLVKRLRRHIAWWALRMPHAYNWIPAAPIALLLWLVLRVSPAPEATMVPPEWRDLAVLIPALAVLTVAIPGAYLTMLAAIYQRLDDKIFDERVRPALESLEQLRFRGGREALDDLRQRAHENPFISDRMKSWIVSTPTVPLVDVHERHTLYPKTGRPASRRDITTEWVEELFKRLMAHETDRAERLLIVDALSTALRILGSGEDLHIQIRHRLQQYLDRAPKGVVSRRIAAALKGGDEEPPLRTWLLSRARDHVSTFFMLWLLAYLVSSYLDWSVALTRICGLATIVGFLNDLKGAARAIAKARE